MKGSTMKKILIHLLSGLLIIVMLVVSAGCNVADDDKDTEETAVQEEKEKDSIDWNTYESYFDQCFASDDIDSKVQSVENIESFLVDDYYVLPLTFYEDLFYEASYVNGAFINKLGYSDFRNIYMTNGSDTLRTNLQEEPESLDYTTTSNYSMTTNIACGLYGYDSSGNLIAELCDSCDISDDGLTYVFHLKSGLRWSDGSSLTADDFVYSWNRALENGSDESYIFEMIDGYSDGKLNVVSDGSTELTVTLSSPFPDFCRALTYPVFYPVKKTSVSDDTKEKGSAYKADFVSCGPYAVTEWVDDQTILLEKNQYYYNSSKISINKIEYVITDNMDEVYDTFMSGDLDFIALELDDIYNEYDTEKTISIGTNYGTYSICFNLDNDFFANRFTDDSVNIRKAISMLIDRKKIASDTGKNVNFTANSLVPPGTLYLDDGMIKNTYEDDVRFDPDAISTSEDETVSSALKLLEDAGFEVENGKLTNDISFSILTDGSQIQNYIAGSISDDLSGYGIDINIKQTTDYEGDLEKGKYDIVVADWSTGNSYSLIQLGCYESMIDP